MFLRKTKSRNSVCFQIGEKINGNFKLIKHVGCASKDEKIKALEIKGNQELQTIMFKNQLSLFPEINKSFKAKLLNWYITGYHLVFGRVYDLVGFPNNLLRDLVISRIVHPKSKTATVRFLQHYLGINVTKDKIYRFLDTLNKEELTKIAYNFVSKKNNGITLIFYDITTLYFETETEDDLRKKGFSKDHRSDMPQILIGLFVDADGYPFDFDFFKGNTFEGKTFIISTENLIKKYNFIDLTVVADAAMLSKDNLAYLDSCQINYIVGARIKNMEQEITEKIIAHDYVKKSIHKIILGNQQLIIEYSEIRAKKDLRNREKIIEKLRNKLNEGKPLIHKNKYLLVKNQSKAVGIDETKIEANKRFDGLKGYITNKNNNNSFKEIINQYHNLWRVEKAFRMSKNDLKERPVFHQNIKRIKSHLILCFVSLLVMKEAKKTLNRRKYSIDQAIEILGKVGQGEARIDNIKIELDSELDQEAKNILKLFEGH